MCNLQKRMETSFLSSLWLANSFFFFCIGHFSKRSRRSSASNFYPIITLCLTDCWNCLARGLILVPNSMYCLRVVFWVVSSLLCLRSSGMNKKSRFCCLLGNYCTNLKRSKNTLKGFKNAKIASVENNNNCFLKEIGNLKQFVTKKSDKIGKSLNSIH